MSDKSKFQPLVMSSMRFSQHYLYEKRSMPTIHNTHDITPNTTSNIDDRKKSLGPLKLSYDPRKRQERQGSHPTLSSMASLKRSMRLSPSSVKTFSANNKLFSIVVNSQIMVEPQEKYKNKRFKTNQEPPKALQDSSRSNLPRFVASQHEEKLVPIKDRIKKLLDYKIINSTALRYSLTKNKFTQQKSKNVRFDDQNHESQ